MPGTKAHAAYGVDEVQERHRHRYEFNNAYREQLDEAGLVVSGTLARTARWSRSAEIERPPVHGRHQFHPEFRSRPDRPHPLFRDFMVAAAKQNASRAGRKAMRF